MNRKAFTLIELLVVVAIIGILAAVGVVAYNGYTGAAKTNVVKSRHSTMLRDIGERLAWCDLGIERYFYFENPTNPAINHIDCNTNNWGLASQFTAYYRNIFRNPHGALNGSDYSTMFVDRNQIPTSCKANEVGYSFLTSWETPRSYFKLGTCYEEGKAPLIGEIDK